MSYIHTIAQGREKRIENRNRWRVSKFSSLPPFRAFPALTCSRQPLLPAPKEDAVCVTAIAAVRGAGDILPHPARRPRAACGSAFGASFGCAAADEHACRSGDTAPGIRPPSLCQFVSLVQWTFLRTRLSQRLWTWRLCDWLQKPPGTHAMHTCNCAHTLFQAFSLDTQACLPRSNITAAPHPAKASLA